LSGKPCVARARELGTEYSKRDLENADRESAPKVTQHTNNIEKLDQTRRHDPTQSSPPQSNPWMDPANVRVWNKWFGGRSCSQGQEQHCQIAQK